MKLAHAVWYGDGLGLIFGRTVLEMDGREHQKHRLLLNPLMNGDDLAALRPLMVSVHRLVPPCARR